MTVLRSVHLIGVSHRCTSHSCVSHRCASHRCAFHSCDSCRRTSHGVPLMDVAHIGFLPFFFAGDFISMSPTSRRQSVLVEAASNFHQKDVQMPVNLHRPISSIVTCVSQTLSFSSSSTTPTASSASREHSNADYTLAAASAAFLRHSPTWVLRRSSMLLGTVS